MTQRIFKKSCKQDMIDLFNILPNEVKYIQKIKYSKEDIEVKLFTNILFPEDNGTITILDAYISFNFKDIFNIDFEDDEEYKTIIKRPIEVVNDLD